MRFVDEAIIEVAAGDGGHGCVSFLRQRFQPKGGPDGGDGGRGGHVILKASNRTVTLADHSFLRHFRAKRGAHGQGSDKTGRGGDDNIIMVPVGTLAYNADTDELIADLTEDGQEVVVARGGRGGKGNRHFATSTNQAPRMAQPGEPGEKFTVRLELKLLASVGLVGLPNAGKSSLISAASRARPKVADYPFTTLTPNLGVVRTGDFDAFTMADIPGLVEGAHQGAGLGLKFLKHIERCRLFLYVIDMSDQDPLAAFETVQAELKAYDPAMARRTSLVAANKMDLQGSDENLTIFKQMLEDEDLDIFAVSAATVQGVPELIQRLAQLLETADRELEAEGEQGPGI